jgi:hypothetical protein
LGKLFRLGNSFCRPNAAHARHLNCQSQATIDLQNCTIVRFWDRCAGGESFRRGRILSNRSSAEGFNRGTIRGSENCAVAAQFFETLPPRKGFTGSDLEPVVHRCRTEAVACMGDVPLRNRQQIGEKLSVAATVRDALNLGPPAKFQPENLPLARARRHAPRFSTWGPLSAVGGSALEPPTGSPADPSQKRFRIGTVSAVQMRSILRI